MIHLAVVKKKVRFCVLCIDPGLNITIIPPKEQILVERISLIQFKLLPVSESKYYVQTGIFVWIAS